MITMARPPTDRPPPASNRLRGAWIHGPVPVIGIVGPIGAGKSSVAKILEEHGAFTLDADAIGHALIDQTPQRELVVSRFGLSILTYPPEIAPKSAIDRSVVGEMVFGNAQALRDLEAILHPAMLRTFQKAIARESRRRRFRGVLIDAAILFEAGWDSLCDAIIFVGAPDHLRHERLQASRGWSLQKMEAREKMQWSVEKKQAGATHQLTNDGDHDALVFQTIEIWKAILVSRRERYQNPRSFPKTNSAPSDD